MLVHRVAKPKVVLASYQQKIVQRIAERCREQAGHFLFHKMGSGKTLTGLFILSNLSMLSETSGGETVDRYILVPESIKSTYDFESPTADAAKMWPNPQDRAFATRSIKVVTYEAFETWLLANDLPDFQCSIMLCDEAHYLLKLLRHPVTGPRLERALLNVNRIILMTGTPILTSPSDIGALVQLVARLNTTTLPSSDANFRHVFYDATQTAKNKSRFLSMAGGIAGGINMAVSMAFKVPFIDNLPGYFKSIGSASTDAGAFSALKEIATVCIGILATTTGSDLATNAAGIAVRSAVGFAITTYATGYFQMLARQDITVLQSDRLVDAISRYMSFFDYELTPVEKGEVPPSLNFPTKQLVPVQIDYDVYQAVLLMHLTQPKLSIIEQRMLGLLKEDSLSDAQLEDVLESAVFNKYARAIGNLSKSCEEWGTRWIRNPDDVTKEAFRPVRRDKRPAVMPADVFRCNRFDHALNALLKLRDTPSDCCWQVDADTQAFVLDENGDKIPTPQERYLPVVYSNYDEAGFRIFSAFLTSKNLQHVVLFGTDSPERRQRAMVAGAYTRYQVGDRSAPVCVLLHPSIVEGLSFTHSPTIIVLEPVPGLGIQEQLYARILRRYSVASRTTKDRPRKKILQYRCTWRLASNWLSYYRATFANWWTNQSHLLPQDGMFSYVHNESSPELNAIMNNAKDEMLQTAIGKALMRLDDSIIGEACSSKKLCNVCTSESCPKHNRCDELPLSCPASKKARRANGRRTTLSKLRAALS